MRRVLWRRTIRRKTGLKVLIIEPITSRIAHSGSERCPFIRYLIRIQAPCGVPQLWFAARPGRVASREKAKFVTPPKKLHVRRRISQILYLELRQYRKRFGGTAILRVTRNQRPAIISQFLSPDPKRHLFKKRFRRIPTASRSNGKNITRKRPPLSLWPGRSLVATPLKDRRVPRKKATHRIRDNRGGISHFCPARPSAGSSVPGNQRTLFIVSDCAASWMDRK